MSNSSIWPIDRTLSGATTPAQSGPGSDGNQGILCIPKDSSITGASLSECLTLYQDTSFLGGEGGLTSLQRSSRCILQPQPTGQARKSGLEKDVVLINIKNQRDQQRKSTLCISTSNSDIWRGVPQEEQPL